MPRLLANCELEAVNCPSEGMAFLGLSGDAATDRHGLVHSQHRTAARSPSAGAHVWAPTHAPARQGPPPCPPASRPSPASPPSPLAGRDATLPSPPRGRDTRALIPRN